MPPGPSILVRFLADMKGLQSATNETATTATSAATRMHGAFDTVLGQLNQTGVLGPFGQSLSVIEQSFQSIGKAVDGIGPKLMGMGGAALGAGLILQQIGSKEKEATQQLSVAITNTGHSYDDYSKQIDAAVKTQERYGHTADETKHALQTLTQATGDPAKALQYLGVSSDYAAAKHKSLEGAAVTMGKAYNGSAKALKEFGLQAQNSAKSQSALASAQKSDEASQASLAKAIQHQADVHEALAGKTKLSVSEQHSLRDADAAVEAAVHKAADAHDKLTTAQDNAKTAAQSGAATLDALGGKLKGQAAAGADSFAGKIRGLKATVIDSAAQFGQKFGPAITTAGAVLSTTGLAIEGAKSVMSALSNATKIQTAVQWALNVAMSANPIVLIVIAIAALVAAFILLYTHSQLVRDVIADMGRIMTDVFQAVVNAAKAAFDWISNNWPLLLAILAGPFGIAVFLIATYWNQIVAFAQSIPGRILGALAGLGGLLVSLGAAMVNGLASGAESAMGAILGTVGGIGGRILGALGDVGNILYNAGRNIIAGLGRGISDALGAVEDKVSSIAGKIASLKGPLEKDYRLLQPAGREIMRGLNDAIAAGMPSLTAQLAAVTGTINLTVGNVAPTRIGGYPPPAPRGPAVLIEHAEFKEAVDVDLLMRRTAWAIRTDEL